MTESAARFKQAKASESQAKSAARQAKVAEAKEKREQTESYSKQVKNYSDAFANIGKTVSGVGWIPTNEALTMRRHANNPQWYLNYGDKVKHAANLPTYYPLKTLVDGLDTNAVPGVVIYNIVPTIPGLTSSGSSYVFSYAMNKLKQFIRKDNSVITGLDATDMMQILFGIAICHGLARKIKRILKAYMSFDSNNHYMNAELLGMLTSTPLATIDANRLAWIDSLNEKITLLNTLPLPKWPIFEHLVSMWDVVIKDEDLAEAQLILLDCVGYYVYSEANSQLTFNYATLSGIDSLINALNNAMADLANTTSQSIDRFYSDIRGAIPANDFITTSELTGDEILEPIISKDFATQLMNAVLPPFVVPNTGSNKFNGAYSFGQTAYIPLPATLHIRQSSDGKNLVQGDSTYAYPYFKVSKYLVPGTEFFQRRTLNFYQDDIAPETVMYATRFTARYTRQADNNDYVIGVRACDCFIMCYVTFATKFYYGNRYACTNLIEVADSRSVSYLQEYVNLVNCVSTVNYHPHFYTMDATIDPQDQDPIQLSGHYHVMQQWGNVVDLLDQNLDNIHKVAVLSQMTVDKPYGFSSRVPESKSGKI